MMIMLPVLLLLLSFSLHGASLSGDAAEYRICDRSGRVLEIVRRSDGQKVVTGVNNLYKLMAHSGDHEGKELEDRVLKSHHTASELFFECDNPALPALRIHKRYWIENTGLRRELTFVNLSGEKKFILPSSESHFTAEFKKDSYYFGAGYLGPYLPAAMVEEPVCVVKYVQSSKGMVLINSRHETGSYVNYRVKINDTAVFPWWQSTIGRYREMEDRLWYLPDGWRMALGTLDLEPNGGMIRYTDALIFFHGTLCNFFDKVLLQDSDFKAALAEIPPISERIQDIFCIPQWGHEPHLRYLTEMIDNGTFIYRSLLSTDWGDYRWEDGFNSRGGGFITADEVRSYIQNIHNISPRIMMGVYAITIATDRFSKLFQERPEWFRRYSRSGDEDPLFPGVLTNFQSMINIPECRHFMADQLFDMADLIGSPFVYLDEAQHQNTINWQRNELIRDDHSVMLWKRMRDNAQKRNKILFFNGSGNPFADINYMEGTSRQLAAENWREFAGIALGLELFSKLRPDGRLALLYWGGNNDYISRCLSLGWIPVPNIGASIAQMRAVYETGKTLPVDARYSPDWKKDPATPVESYSVRRRHTDDILISFVNRKIQVCQLPITVELDSLGFPADARINVWAMPTQCKAEKEYVLSDTESRDNYQKYGWCERIVSAPKLIYSGNASGILHHEFTDVSPNQLVQLVITQGSMAIWSLDGLPQNYFYRKRQKATIEGQNVISGWSSMEVLLADMDHVFTDVTVNGQLADIKNIDIGGMLFQCVRLNAGNNQLDWKRTPRQKTTQVPFTAELSHRQVLIHTDVPETLFALERNGRTVFTGTSPIALPEQFENGNYIIRQAGQPGERQTLSLSGGKKSRVKYQEYPQIPEQVRINELVHRAGNLTVTREATFLSRHRQLRQLQTNLEPCEVHASAATLKLYAGTTRREDIMDIDHYAGLEFSGAETLRLKLKNSFYKAYSLGGDHNHVYSKVPKKDFSGFVVDYRVDGNYVKRVNFSIGLGGEALKNPNPAWGCNRVQDLHVDLGNLLSNPERIFSLDLKKFAPENWDGTVFFSVGNNHIEPNRTLDVEILEVNRLDAGDFIDGIVFGSLGKVDKPMPAPLALPTLKSAPQSMQSLTSEWQSWAKISALLPYPGDQALREQTRGYLACDAQNLYIAIEADEKGRALEVSKSIPWNNDCVEVYYQAGDKQIVQILVDAAGRAVSFPGSVLNETIIKTSQNKHQGYIVFLAIPWKTLKLKGAVPGESFKFNLCRTRLEPGAEKSSWGPARKEFGFRDVERYGTVTVGRKIDGTEQYEIFTVE